MEKKRLGMGVTVVALCGVLAGGMALAGCTGTAPAGDAGEKTPATGAATEAPQVDDETVALTPKEFQILSLMADSPGRVFTRDDLIEALWGEEYESSNISIPVYIRRIRMKIEPDPSNPVHLKTVWRFGYRLE